MLVLLNDLLAKATHLVIIVVNKLLSNDQDNLLKDRQVMLKVLMKEIMVDVSNIVWGLQIYNYTSCMYLPVIEGRKKNWQKNVQCGCVCDEMQLVVVLLPNTPARKLRMVPLQSDECMSG